MVKNDKITHLMKKAAPFIAGLAGDVNEDTVDQDIQAIVMALEAHKQGVDHDPYDHTWNGINIFNKVAQFTDQLVINHDGSDSFSFFWDGLLSGTTKPFRPAELIINRISETAPETTFAGMVWVDTNA